MLSKNTTWWLISIHHEVIDLFDNDTNLVAFDNLSCGKQVSLR